MHSALRASCARFALPFISLLPFAALADEAAPKIDTGDTAWLMAYRFWTKVFALSFALGVVVPMPTLPLLSL